MPSKNKIEWKRDGNIIRKYSNETRTFYSSSIDSNACNCKLVTINAAANGVLGTDENAEQFAKQIYEIVKYKFVFFHLSQFILVNRLKKFFDVVYIIEPPIGYSGRPQWHCLVQARKTEYDQRIKSWHAQGNGGLNQEKVCPSREAKDLEKIMAYKTERGAMNYIKKLKAEK